MQKYENYTCCVADVQMHHIFLVQEEGAEVNAAGRQHSFVGLEVHPVHDKGAVTQQALPALTVKLLQDLPAVPRELHRPEGLRMVEEAGGQEEVTCGTLGKAQKVNSRLDQIVFTLA